jgi:hypothetical protein
MATPIESPSGLATTDSPIVVHAGRPSVASIVLTGAAGEIVVGLKR